LPSASQRLVHPFECWLNVVAGKRTGHGGRGLFAHAQFRFP